MNYIAITEVRDIPEYVEPRKYSSDEIAKIMAEAMFSPIDLNKQSDILPKFITIKITEETFKFIESVAIVSFPVFGEKEYKINDLKFTIHTEEEYEKRYGKPETIEDK